jgi:hypothetical protein
MSMFPPDQLPTFATAALIGLVLLGSMLSRRFDPFAPLWLFLAGFAQVYVVQAISYRDYALRARGAELVTAANTRALWALVWFLFVYHCGIGKALARRLPRVASCWSPGLVVAVSPPLIAWGLICAGVALRSVEVAQEENIFRAFPVVMLVSGVMLIVTGRQPARPRPVLTAWGLSVILAYVAIWMFNGRRSHAVIGVLTGICAWYVPRFKRPSMPVLAVTGAACALVVSLALGWRNNQRYEPTPAGFVRYLTEFDPSSVLVNLNLKERTDGASPFQEQESKETEEYGGFLLMMHAVPELSDYDYGSSYLRIISTFIPRLLWADKPIYGRDAWVNAWIAGSEFKRKSDFTGPAISLLGATQLNGGPIATVIVLGVLSLLLRTAYDYFRLHAHLPWAQVWWSLTYYNAWLMTVNDDPMVWFYYIYGHTTLPPMAALWVYLRLNDAHAAHAGPAAAPARAAIA